MGQSSSSLSVASYQSSYKVPTGKRVVYDLSDGELKSLVRGTSLDIESVRECATEIQKQASQDDTDNEDGFYEDDDDDDDNNDDSGKAASDLYSMQAQLAFRLVHVSPKLAKLRFRLVPTKLKEPMFWKTVFFLLHEELNKPQRSVSSKIKEITLTDEHGNVIVQDKAAPSQQSISEDPAEPSFSTTASESASTSNPSNSVGLSEPSDQKFVEKSDEQSDEESDEESEQSDEESEQSDDEESEQSDEEPDQESPTISAPASAASVASSLSQEENDPVLNKKVQQLKSEVSRLKEMLKSQKQQAKNDLPSNSKHPGKWIVSQDSQEFLQFPDEVKDNMRKEKQKRLAQVRKEMKFILDSENIEDTNGHWDCCKATEYHEECTCKNAMRAAAF